MKSILWQLSFLASSVCFAQIEANSSELFGNAFPKLDHLATGEWWKIGKNKSGAKVPQSMKPERSQVIAFALYSYDAGILKLTAQLYPLMPEEPREVRLEIKKENITTNFIKIFIYLI